MEIIDKIPKTIKQGGLVVLPTDTIYGIHASIFLPKAIKRLYLLKGRQGKKPFIILINEVKDIEKLGINIPDDIRVFLKKVWPGKVTVIFPKGTNSLAFRMPKNKLLKEVIFKTGPIISTSVNPSGKDPAKSIKEAFGYFGEKIDLYVDGGRRNGTPSTIIEIKNGKLNLLRQGSVKIDSTQ